MFPYNLRENCDLKKNWKKRLPHSSPLSYWISYTWGVHLKALENWQIAKFLLSIESKRKEGDFLMPLL